MHENDIVNQVCSCVLENIDGGLSLKTISEQLYINKSHISEVFKQKTGMQFIEYLTAVKMERAKKVITDSKLKTYEIADMLGFKDIEYFSKLFKKYIGCSPTEYRQKTIDKA
jgi:two-component system response regulator YesN